MTDAIAETELVVRRSTGEVIHVTLRVFQPAQCDDGASWTVELEGLHSSGFAIKSIDRFDALMLAIRFAGRLLADDEERHKSVITLPDDPNSYDWKDSWFSGLKDRG
jgi:hypothetical protein